MKIKQALKYQQRDRLTVAQIHPSLRFTRLAAVLREHATAGDDIGALAHQALTSDHSQPLDLMPLHLLKDKMQEEPDHPLAKAFNWKRVPALAEAYSAVQQHTAENPSQFRGDEDGAVLRHPLTKAAIGKRIAHLPEHKSLVDAAVEMYLDAAYSRADAAQQMVAGFRSAPEDVHTKLASQK